MSHYCCKKCGLRYDDCSCAVEAKKEKEMSKIFKVWTVHRNNDDRSNGPVTDVCSNANKAAAVALGSGWYGGNAPVGISFAVEVDGNVYLLESNKPVDLDGQAAYKTEEIKKKALAKLSPEEIAALGIKE